MGQITNPTSKGITVLPTDRESGPGAGAGATGNNSIFLGLNAGKNSSAANFIAIGNNTADGGVTSTNLSGSTVVGAQSVQLVTGATVSVPGFAQGITVLGQGNFNATTSLDSSVIVGQSILPANTSVGNSQSVFIGNGIGAQGAANVSFAQSVLIGFGIMPLATNFGQGANVIIGWKALAANTFDITSSVWIGNNVGPQCGTSGSSSNDVVIGSLADISTGQSACVVIGYTAVSKSGQGAATGNVVIGANATAGSGTFTDNGSNIAIGYSAKTALGASTTGGNISIGTFAGLSIPINTSNTLIIENNVSSGGSQQSLIYGSFATGNIILGNSVDGTNRDLNGTNTLKLLNGTKNAAPVGGGYFYVTGGFLHWVDPNGTDSQLSQTVAGQLASNALNAYTNNAGAQIATITNGPTAGNPTKWIPINDDGVIRNIPAW